MQAEASADSAAVLGRRGGGNLVRSPRNSATVKPLLKVLAKVLSSPTLSRSLLRISPA
jgi:hypothetical protein